jgi:hypothetical protein
VSRIKTHEIANLFVMCRRYLLAFGNSFTVCKSVGLRGPENVSPIWQDRFTLCECSALYLLHQLVVSLLQHSPPRPLLALGLRARYSLKRGAVGGCVQSLRPVQLIAGRQPIGFGPVIEQPAPQSNEPGRYEMTTPARFWMLNKIDFSRAIRQKAA